MTRLVFMGTPEFAVPTLERLVASDYAIVGVYTQPDKPAGRGRKLAASPVKELAVAHNLPVFQPRTLRAPEAHAELAALQPDVIVVAAYGLILPQAALDLPPHGCINVHASLLPKYRGAAPIPAAILNGDETTGITIMRMDAGVDTGPMLAQAALPLCADDTTGALTARLAQLGADLLGQTLPRWLAGEIAPQAQDEAQATFAPRFCKEDGRLDWTLAAVDLERRIRAFDPWPGAFTTCHAKRLKVNRARASDFQSDANWQPGQVIWCGDRVGVVTGQGVLELLEVQMEGKRSTQVADFLCGQPDFVGMCLGA
jgi:methionyl-tRNA formyltransferase